MLIIKVRTMRTKSKLIISSLVLFIAVESLAQDTASHPNLYPEGISIAYGLGSYSVKDEYISNEKYSGMLPYYSVGWVRQHNKYIYKLEMAYRYSNEIYNYNVSSEITQLNINQGFLYPLEKKTLFTKDLYIWLGPSTELFLYYGKPKIAVTGFDYTQSYAILFALGLNADAIYPFNSNIQLESSLSLTALSLGWRMVDVEEENQSPVKLLTLFSGLHTSIHLGVRYYLSNQLSIKLAYLFELTRVSAWNPLLSASDNVILGLTYRF